jgi:hypothetical protein
MAQHGGWVVESRGDVDAQTYTGRPVSSFIALDAVANHGVEGLFVTNKK